MFPSRSRKSSLCFLFVTAIVIIFFQRFREREFILGDEIVDPPDSPPVVDTSDVDLDFNWRPQPVQNPLLEISQPVLGEHEFRPDGLLQVNLEGAHPIYELISQAEKAWKKKLRNASKSFDEAVQEYKRRYRRAPPRGFDLWWKYATEHDVLLPDEYDQIYHDLEPFWGIDPADLIEIQKELELKKDSYTIGKNETSDVGVLTYAFTEGRYNQLIASSGKVIDLFKDIQEYLPPFRMTISPHDAPNRLSDYAIKQAALEAAANRMYIERASLSKPKNLGWVSACSPDSPARQRPINLDSPPPRSVQKTFISDHLRSMDPCDHPELFYHHGQFLSHNLGPGPQPILIPEFSYCSTVLHHNIRIPTPYSWVEDIYPRSHDPEWDDKFDDRLLWRGSNTGMFHSKTTRWKHSQRDFLVEFANDLDGVLDVLPYDRSKNEKLVETRELKKDIINPITLDIAFAGQPIACTPEVCDLLKHTYPWHKRQSNKDAGNYKYVIDVDGNGWSGRFKRLITSNSLIFKSTIYPEWFADRVAPWVHYVPIQIDFSDLHDALLFFRGDENGDGSHEYLARKIASAGRQWSKRFWRKEDLVSYFFRLTLEYTRLMSLDRESMSYHG